MPRYWDGIRLSFRPGRPEDGCSICCLLAGDVGYVTGARYSVSHARKVCSDHEQRRCLRGEYGYCWHYSLVLIAISLCSTQLLDELPSASVNVRLFSSDCNLPTANLCIRCGYLSRRFYILSASKAMAHQVLLQVMPVNLVCLLVSAPHRSITTQTHDFCTWVSERLCCSTIKGQLHDTNAGFTDGETKVC